MKGKESSAKEEKDALMSELQAQTKEKTKLEFTLKDLRDEVAGDSNSKERAEQALATAQEVLEGQQAQDHHPGEGEGAGGHQAGLR